MGMCLSILHIAEVHVFILKPLIVSNVSVMLCPL